MDTTSKSKAFMKARLMTFAQIVSNNNYTTEDFFEVIDYMSKAARERVIEIVEQMKKQECDYCVGNMHSTHGCEDEGFNQCADKLITKLNQLKTYE